MTSHTVTTPHGTLEVLLGSATSGRVMGTITVNRVEVEVHVYIQPNKNPHALAPLGTPVVEHTTVRKPGDYRWEPSYNMRSKVAAVAMQAFFDVVSVEANAHQAEVEKIGREIEIAQREMASAQEIVTAQALKIATLNERLLVLQEAVSA